ncbi:MAG: hypothetical protein R2810_03990 [Flavobacteriales bacterium]
MRDGKYAELGDRQHRREREAPRPGKGEFRYLIAEMYDDVFFPRGAYVADTVEHRQLDVERGSRFEKYRSELSKKFMFNPGQEIASAPLHRRQARIVRRRHGRALRPPHLGRCARRGGLLRSAPRCAKAT